MGAVLVTGGTIGAAISRRVAITDLPQLVAAFHSFVGAAAVATAAASYWDAAAAGATHHVGAGTELLASANSASTAIAHHGSGHLTADWAAAVIGAMTFSGSLVAFGKLQASAALVAHGAGQVAGWVVVRARIA